MKKNLTELVFVLDMSGSMAGLTDDTIGGFNSVLKQHSSGEGEVLVTTYLFNNESRMLHDRIPVAEVTPMTDREYCAGGCTALIDALGSAIRHIASVHRYAREEDIPEHTIFIITTDGMENASHMFSADKVREMVKHEQEKYGWEFIFLAANIDAVETAVNYGINPQRAVNYHNDGAGTATLYKTVSGAVGSIRSGCSLDEAPCWREEADRDFNNRK
ncbi:MAG: VWA domain-containing protein [Eubacteriales bacterium]|nr:VWA domain-containing protein [Eubacteriales bacterium]